jgi:propanediol utilization protein
MKSKLSLGLGLLILLLNSAQHINLESSQFDFLFSPNFKLNHVKGVNTWPN